MLFAELLLVLLEHLDVRMAERQLLLEAGVELELAGLPAHEQRHQEQHDERARPPAEHDRLGDADEPLRECAAGVAVHRTSLQALSSGRGPR